jgi:DNA repair exonuclease SbcCD ATPase subunit
VLFRDGIDFSKTGIQYFLLILVISCLFLFTGCGDDTYPSEGLSNKHKDQFKSLKTRISELKEENEGLQIQNQNYQKEIDVLISEKKVLDETVKKQTEEIRKLKEKNVWRKRALLLVTAVVLGFPVAILIGMLFAKPKRAPDLQARTECPRCHWELEPDTAICVNPDCKTRLR